MQGCGQADEKKLVARVEATGMEQPLQDHLLEVSESTSRLAMKIGLARCGQLLGLAHDLGKYSAAFQDYIHRVAGNASMEMEPRFSERGSVDHSTAGAQVIAQGLSGVRIVAEVLAICVASHHMGLIDCIHPDGFDGLVRRLEKNDRDTHRREAMDAAAPEIRGRLETLLRDPALSGEMNDVLGRIASADNEEAIRCFKEGLLVRVLFSCLIDADRTNSADFGKVRAAAFRQHEEYVPWAVLINRLETRLSTMQSQGWVDDLRREISQHCLEAASRPRGIFTLTVPTGGGKTLASLRFALHHAKEWGMDRVIYVCPYISITDQNAQVAREILEPAACDFASIVLEHHSNLSEEKASWRGSVLSENWDAPVVFTTAVQVLEALFGGGTRSVRRLHALSKAVIVFDEVQTLPVRMIHLFNNAVNFLVEQCGASVVLCTATQPLLHKVDASKGTMNSGIELMPDAARLFRDLKRYDTFDRTAKPGGWSIAEVSALALAELSEHRSCLTIVNTKRSALAIYAAWKASLEQLGEVLEDGCLVHLSTRMCPAHRKEALEGMKTALLDKKRVLCVSTQLIEAGVDIDFATVVRDLAGLDSLAQAAGRCNRNGRRPTGRMHIVKTSEPLPKQLDEIVCAQKNAQRVLDDWREECGERLFDLSDPEEMRRFFSHHFFSRRGQMDYPVDGAREDTLLQMMGENGMAVAEARAAGNRRQGLMQSFRSAADSFRIFENCATGVVIPFREKGKSLVSDLSAAQDIAVEFRLLRQAQQFMVNVFPWELQELQKCDAIYEAQPGSGLMCLRDGFYSDEFGLSIEGSGGMESLFA